MRTYDDAFSGQRIYPGKGKLFIRGDSKIFRFQNSKSESLFLQRKNPRRIAWTVLCRRHFKKGIQEETSKRRNRRTVKAHREIVGATMALINDRRNPVTQKQLQNDSKKKNAAAKEKRDKIRAANATRQSQARPSKMGAKGAQVKVQAQSR